MIVCQPIQWRHNSRILMCPTINQARQANDQNLADLSLLPYNHEEPKSQDRAFHRSCEGFCPAQTFYKALQLQGDQQNAHPFRMAPLSSAQEIFLRCPACTNLLRDMRRRASEFLFPQQSSRKSGL